MIISFKASWGFELNIPDRILMTRKKQRNIKTWKVMALTSLALMLPSSIAVGLLIGYFLDKILGTRPWMLLIFLILGTASGLYSLFRGLNRFQDEEETEDT